MIYPSRSVGKFHFVLLAVNLAVSAALLATTVLYFADPDFYWQHVTQLDWTVLAFHKSFFVLVHVSFAVWMFRVHMAVMRIHPRYPVGPGGFLVRMLPLVQLWGIGSTFNQLGKYFAGHPSLTSGTSRVNRFIPFIYIFYYGVLLTYPSVHSLDRSSSAILSLSGSVLSVAMYSLFLVAANRINQCLFVCVRETPVIEDIVPAFTSSRVQANIWIRLAARLIDGALFLLLTMAAVIIGLLLDGEKEAYFTISLVAMVWLGWVVYLALHLSLRGQTFGKWLLRIRIVNNVTGENGGFVPNFLLRGFVNYLISSFVPLYSLVDVCFIFSSDARCIHDRLAGTMVVEAATRAADPYAGAADASLINPK